MIRRLIILLLIVGCEEALEPEDCAGVAGGTAAEDMCSICDSDATNDCVQDCAGVWGGNSYLDECGGCDANVNNDCIQDCAGEWGGDSVLDACGVCDNSPNTGICDVAWVTTEGSLNLSTGVIVFPYLYYTEGYEPTVIDTLFSCHPFYDFDSPLGYSYDDCIQMCEELNESQSLPDWAEPLNCPEVPNVSYFIYSFKGDTILFADSVKSIAHFIPINYFEVIKLDDNTIQLNPNDYDADIFRFEYK